MPRQNWKRRTGAQLILANGDHLFRENKLLALALVESGLAVVIVTHPLIVRITAIRKILGARIPSDCKQFIEEYVAMAGYFYDHQHRTRKPRCSVEMTASVEEGHVPLPVNYHRGDQT